MAKIIRLEDQVTVIYEDGNSVSKRDDEVSSLFVFAVLNQDDEEILKTKFPVVDSLKFKQDKLEELQSRLRKKHENPRS